MPEPQSGISHLSRAERILRGQIAISARWGQDTTEAHLVFDRLKAERQLREAVQRLLEAREAQGLPDQIEDSDTLARIAGLIAEPALSMKCGPRHLLKPKAAEREATANVNRSG
jgi:hypothetical protein